jgi:diaminohydroxyphosphoribosylaminopyrimidine deaminase/5-amino-6-(5-phosphoribosylamino)uracil reductase
MDDKQDRYISRSKSLKYIHQIRSKIDLLVIGGQTVRYDRPTLDCRLDCRLDTDNKAPDVLIYTHKDLDEFDSTIPLFQVPNRSVMASDSLNSLSNLNNIENKYILSEGGVEFAKSIIDNIDMFLIVIGAKYSQTKNLTHQLGINLKVLYTKQFDDDILIWAIKDEK